MTKKTLFGALVCVLLSIGVEAAEVTFTGSASSTDGSSPLSFGVSQFNSSVYGTLTGVSLTVDVGQVYTFKLSNVGAADTWTINGMAGNFRLNDSFSNTDSAFNFSNPYSVSADSTSYVNPTTSTTFSKTYGAESAFVGSGTVGMSAAFSGVWFVSSGIPQIGDGFETTGIARNVGWSVTYTYDVPEPTSMALLALGVAVLGLRRKHRKSI